MAISKVIYKSSASAQGETWVDLTADTVASGNLISPNTAHGADGQSITGSVGSGTEGTPIATKGAVSNHSVNITPSVTNTAGVISGGTHTGTQVTVTAAELESGTKSITQNGTGIDVTGYSAVDVAVPSGTAAVIDVVEQLPGGGEHHIITGVDISDTTAVASDVAQGKYFYTADGTKTQGTGHSGATIEEYATGAWPTGAISLSNTVTTIAEYAFYYNTAITGFSAPECTFLKWNALRGCSSLTSISFPKVTAIGRASSVAQEGYALAGCTALQTIHLPELLTAYGGYNLSGLGKTGAFVTIVLPKITDSGDHLFRGSKADAIDLGPNFELIHSYSLYGGTYNNIILRRTSVVTAAAANAISSLNSSSKVYVPQALIDSYKAASNWSDKGDIFYAIEGSIYENYYADGTPIQTT